MTITEIELKYIITALSFFIILVVVLGSIIKRINNRTKLNKKLDRAPALEKNNIENATNCNTNHRN